jgi:hypothetical protein
VQLLDLVDDFVAATQRKTQLLKFLNVFFGELNRVSQEFGSVRV